MFTLSLMTSAEFLRWLRKEGCVVEKERGRGGHVMVTRGSRKTFVPTHGSSRELGTGLVKKIKRDLGLA